MINSKSEQLDQIEYLYIETVATHGHIPSCYYFITKCTNKQNSIMMHNLVACPLLIICF
jgi:hypothetical protein